MTNSNTALIPRLAMPNDAPSIRALVVRSARGLSVGFYTPEQIEAAIVHVFGVDSQLISDSTYYVIDSPDGLAAAGGWSKRRTLFGGDQMKTGADPLLDPAIDAARIRAFFVDPRWARRGLARTLYSLCARAASAAGFQRFELMATAPGEPFYTRLGFRVLERVELVLPPNVPIAFTRMARDIDSTSHADPPPPA
jgi:GNAT superfamily N-acetyltransferase